MRAARRALGMLPLAALLFTTAGPAAAFVKPKGGQEAYEIPLRAFDLNGVRSAAIDADRSRAETALSRAYRGTWKVYAWNPQSRTPSEIYGSGAAVAGSLRSADQVRAEAERIIRENPDAFGADLGGLRFQDATSSPAMENPPDGVLRPGKWAAHFRQVYHGIDVAGGDVHLTFTDSGRLFALGSTYYADISVDWAPGISAERAKEIARDALPFDAQTDSVETAATLLVLPVPLSETRIEHHLVWETRVHTREPLGIWATSVDAHTGRILRRTNEINFFTFSGSTAGQVERFSHCDGSQQEVLPYVWVNIPGVGGTYGDGAGNWSITSGSHFEGTLVARLVSPYVDVQNMDGASAEATAYVYAGLPVQIVFDDSNSRPEERDVYQTVQDIHNFFETFAAGFSLTNQQVTAQVDLATATCNAWTSGGVIQFYQAGDGCANTGRMMDVVAHEYGHCIQQTILGSQGNEGLGEGNADITGFFMTMSPHLGRGMSSCSSWVRDADNLLQYPDDVVGQDEHSAGQVIAGFHWDAMQDQIARYGTWGGRYSAAWDWHWGRVLQRPTTQPAQVLATFIANDNDGDLTNGTPEFDSYCLAATNHGFDCPNVTLWAAPWGCGEHYQAPQFFGINQQSNYWTVVGVAPSPGDDKDLTIFAADYMSWLGSSTVTEGTDFVVGDFNHNPLGVYHPYVSYGDAATAFVVSWDSDTAVITPGVDVSGTVGGESGDCGLVRIWDVYLNAGQSYAFGLLNTGGSADMRMSLFRNPVAGTYWAGRSSSVFEQQAGMSRIYTAPVSDWYGVVVFNASPGLSEGAYTLRVQDAPVVMPAATCQAWPGSPRIFGFSQNLMEWTGVAVNPSGSDDKDIAVYHDPGGAGVPLASSAWAEGTDFVVGDFNHNAAGTYYPRVSYGDASTAYRTEWEGDLHEIALGTDVNGSVGGGGSDCGLIQVSDVYLTEGQQYRFLLLADGTADVRMALFHNPSNSTFWAGRGSAEFEAGNADGRTYTAPATDWYGVVVFNNSPDSPAGNFTLRVREAPVPLTDAVCQASSPNPRMFSFTQTSAYWSAVAVNPSGTDDKDVWVFDNPDGLGNPVGFSIGIGGTDFVIGDFDHTAPGTYYPMATHGAAPADYVMEWDNGPDIFPLETGVDGMVGGNGGDCGLVKVWDTYLEAGTTYQLVLTTAGDADIRAALFRNPSNAPYWAGRSDAEFEMWPGVTVHPYTAPATDYYGLVVFNASPDARAGTYTLRLDGPAAALENDHAVEPGITFRNPYTAGLPITVRAAADGTSGHVDVYNVQGQLVRTLLDGSEPIGKAGRQLAWDGRTGAGSRLGSGIYFLRAQIGSTRVNRTLLLSR